MVIYYINYDGINCSVFDSQIYTYCKLLSENNLKVKLINCDTFIGTDEYKDKMKVYLNSDNLSLLSIKKNKILSLIINRKLTKKIIKLIKIENLIGEKIIIHCRGPFGSFIGLRIRKELKNYYNIKVVSDFRGAVIDEYLMRNKDKNIIYKMILKLFIIKINSIQSNVCKNSDYVLCVSKKLEEYLNYRYSVNCRVSIIPTCLDADNNRFNLEQREKIRDDLNLKHKFIVVYCGGAQGYQNPEGLIKAFIKIGVSIDEAVFLIVTPDKKIFETYLIKLGVDKSKYLIVTASHNEVYKYLSAADCAILLRDNINVNKVASPTKFAEYINCNLPVYISHNIGDIDEISDKYNICIYEENIYNIRAKIHEIKRNEENFKSLVHDYYEWGKNIKTIISIYNNL